MKNISILLLLLSVLAQGSNIKLDDWKTIAPREEIRPSFSSDPAGGPEKTGSLIIAHDQREGLDGWYQRSFEVNGGDYYRFKAVRKITNVPNQRQSALVRVVWRDASDRGVSADVPESQIKELGHVPSAEPEYPVDSTTDADGWTVVSGLYRAPLKAKNAIIELHLQWAPNGRIEWSGIQFEPVTPPTPRKVRLAAAHYKPKGKSSRQNCEEYAPLIEEAGKAKVDLIVLGETITSVGVNRKMQEIAEPVPGPTTQYFSELAKKNKIHIVFSLNERQGHLIYNAAVLIGPEGNLIGKYRKVSLPPSEAAGGTAPGSVYPVFDTRLGKVGMMICYDGFFPEVARELSKRGAEIIAWPVWGCNPLLAQARACENHIFLVSSTFMEPRQGWMISAIFDQTGKPISQASAWGTIAIAEIDLNQNYIGPYNLGDFRSMIPRHRPMVMGENESGK